RRGVRGDRARTANAVPHRLFLHKQKTRRLLPQDHDRNHESRPEKGKTRNPPPPRLLREVSTKSTNRNTEGTNRNTEGTKFFLTGPPTLPYKMRFRPDEVKPMTMSWIQIKPTAERRLLNKF